MRFELLAPIEITAVLVQVTMMTRSLRTALATFVSLSLSACIFSGSGKAPPTTDSHELDAGHQDATNDASTDSARQDAQTGTDADASRDDATLACEPPTTRCGDVCVDLEQDESHCGQCDLACADAAPPNAHVRGCDRGRCIYECDEGYSDLDGDRDHPDGNGCESTCVPVAAEEVRCDGIDDNCNGRTDEGVTTTFFRDRDEDGHGGEEEIEACERPEDYAVQDDDCDDGDASVHPGAEEVCNNGKDDDCSGAENDGLAVTDYFRDADGDGWGDPMSRTEDCAPPEGFVLDNQDCDDSRDAVNPGAIETCDDGLDNECDGMTDCDDPDCPPDQTVAEVCDNGLDDNCDGDTDCQDDLCCSDSACLGNMACANVEHCANTVDDDGDYLKDCADDDCSAYIECGHRVFVTSSRVTPNWDDGINSGYSADEMCDMAAFYGGYMNVGIGGSWKAIVATSTVPGYTRVAISGKVYNLENELVANDDTEFWSDSHQAPINVTETGTRLGINDTAVWTGMSAIGAYSGLNCDNWRSTQVMEAATVGSAQSTDSGWASSTIASCDLQARLYCIDGQ